MAKEVKPKRPKRAAAAKTRTRKLDRKLRRVKAKKNARQRKPLPGVFRLTGRVAKMIGRNWKSLGGIVLVYLILNVIFASGISNISTAFSNIKADLNASGGRNLWHAATGFASLVGSAGASGSATGSALQSTLFVIESLVIIWALRHIMSDQKISIKLAYYKAPAPLIPFLLVIAVILIQLLPVTIGGAVLAAISGSAFTDTTIATIVSTAAFILLALWSIYMVSSSIFALYIVTLPDAQPRQSLRAARDLVRFRRLTVIRKVVFLPIVIFIVMALITVPLILWASGVVPIAFYILSMLAILFVHSYLYSLYRGLLE